MHGLRKVTNASAFFYGDFNCHVGNGADFGIPGNNSDIGQNGHAIINWMEKWDLTIFDSRFSSNGIWTRQERMSRSILDLVICNNEMLKNFKSMVVDDQRELNAHVSTDHNLVVTLLGAKYNRITWQKPESLVWNYKEVEESKFQEDLSNNLKERMKDGIEKLEVEEINRFLKEALETTREQLLRKTTISPTKKRKSLPKEVVVLLRKICETEKEKFTFLRKIKNA